jgi:hypothetical protein
MTVDAANTYLMRNFSAPTSEGYQSFSARVTVEQTDDSIGYFYAHQFQSMQGNGGYIGLQTRLSMPDGSHNRGVIFSIFAAESAYPAGDAPAGTVAVYGSEGGVTFASLHVPFAWITGHQYKFFVTCYKDGNGHVTQAREAWFYDSTLNQTHHIGTIYVPDGWDGFTNWINQWTEEYSPSSYAACTDILVTKSVWSGALCYMTRFSTATAGVASSVPSIQTGAGICTNSAVNVVSVLQKSYRQIIGATS